MTWILLYGRIMPRVEPAEDGSLRTLTCVVVVPSTGAAVGASVGGNAVWVGGGGRLAGSVEVMMNNVGVSMPPRNRLRPHPEVNIAEKMMNRKSFRTKRF